ncbi:MAG: integrase [Pseudohongiella sp.]|nr:integrase [Pseudohongiella sp.]|tara:strand:+ start:309 stop:887 length:579 start_codon:yes stop_codon:yes gene_type:complete
MTWELYNNKGSRKYLSQSERMAVLAMAATKPAKIDTLCNVLVWTGCRLSEALALTPDKIDRSEKLIIFECLKKRRRGVYRAVPVPEALIARLTEIHPLDAPSAHTLLWSMSRTTAWRHIKTIMAEAGLAPSAAATPRGLRHGFGVAAVSAGIPLNVVQRWLGHAQISTTAIYANASGAEERSMAAKMWSISN